MDRETIGKRAREYHERELHPEFKDEVRGLIDAGAWKELEDRFYTELEFGTGGLRGIIGAGYNRMNPLMVRRASQGLAAYIKANGGTSSPSIVIAHDSRRYSDVFTLEAARVFCGNGIRTFLFRSLRPVPALSFAVRRLGATSGVVITASHNPAAYNGYKVYWADGGQVVPPHDTGIIDEVRKVGTDIRTMGIEEAAASGMLVYLDGTMDDAFVEMVKGHILRPKLVSERAADLKVVYTPLHGSGTMLIERTLGELGIEVITVAEQREPDGDFPTVAYPNPEEPDAMEMALDYGRRNGADLVMGTDPDGDRLGIAVPGPDGFVLVTGNQLGSLLADYILSSLKDEGRMPDRPVIVKTIVTTELQRLIADGYGARTVDVLTGFKYIAEKMREFEGTGESFVFGAEESYGFLVETEARDKDAVSAAVITAEMALYNLSRGMTVLDHLYSLYRRHGYFEEDLRSFSFKGREGLAAMEALMQGLRDSPPVEIDGRKVSVFRDYSTGKGAGTEGLPKSNVIQLVLEDGSIVTARPSGTEPKIKFYASCRSAPTDDLAAARTLVGGKIESLMEYLSGLVGG